MERSTEGGGLRNSSRDDATTSTMSTMPTTTTTMVVRAGATLVCGRTCEVCACMRSYVYVCVCVLARRRL